MLKSLEPMTMQLGQDTTPIDRFFVCSAGDAPVIEAESWTLEIFGDAAREEALLSLADLHDLDQHELLASLECAGNGRQLFADVAGFPQQSPDETAVWTLGAMGQARWSGPRLSDVLELGGVDVDAAWVSAVGMDIENAEGEPIRMCMPIEKALHPDTIVALRMNDASIPIAHGYPARVIVPGWIGAYSVKWIDRIEISSTWVSSWRADEFYQLRTPDGTKLGPATVHPIKSCLALDWPAELEPGPHRIMGYARSPGVIIDVVEWSLDGAPWTPAALVGENEAWSWSTFQLDVFLEPGEHTIRTRAVDAAGRTQPKEVEFNENRILWNGITPHPISVRSPGSESA